MNPLTLLLSRPVSRCAVALGLAWAAWTGPAAAAYEVQDDRGQSVRFEAPPQRIISLLPSLTESVCEMGACPRLVGVDRYSTWPVSVRALPHLGGLDDANVEGIVALRPDVVLLAKSARVTPRLEQLGLKVLALEPKTHADVQRVLHKIGQVLQVPEAQGAARIWRVIDAEVSAAAQSLPARVRQTRVYYEVNRAPYAAGESSFIGETLTRLGARNVVPASLGPFPKLNPEFVVRANPDLIMIGDRNFEGLSQRPGWERIRAVRENRICRFAPEQSDVLVRPGPRMGEAARLMARCLQEMAP
ncbi:helical backbone metal receptor [Curvibacter sp. HBC61]|uniref:Helical backbone metal receptor n=1 Tax=Curvibacter cyanobacteriorum TaxID=3026422 RepID=A0ABT5MXN5_9BURK|nr:helical backbone metal receptor [Curvibacter sp. HBC61]MDD0838816.1 helical backbone metal receptor [Curvibacter sp. HBC61]